MSQTTNNKKKIGIGIAVLVVLIAAALIIYFVAKPKTAQGAKALTIEVVDDQGASKSYEVHTDAEYLRQAMEEAEEKRENQIAEMQAYVAELKETEPGAYDGTILLSVKGESDGQQTAVAATREEIQQVFGIMQMNATEGAEAITRVKSENVLILLHAADTRKTIKDAAKKQADNIFSTSDSTNESAGSNATTGTNTEGADT